MKIISHRGNVNGSAAFLENSKPYLQRALDLGFDVECDVWSMSGELYLGHDGPFYQIKEKWLQDRKSRLWIHCKNLECVEVMSSKGLHFFWHENDLMTLTSRGVPWCRREIFLKGGITVRPRYEEFTQKNILGICTDEPLRYLENV